MLRVDKMDFPRISIIIRKRRCRNVQSDIILLRNENLMLKLSEVLPTSAKGIKVGLRKVLLKS